MRFDPLPLASCILTHPVFGRLTLATHSQAESLSGDGEATGLSLAEDVTQPLILELVDRLPCLDLIFVDRLPCLDCGSCLAPPDGPTSSRGKGSPPKLCRSDS